VAAVHADDVAIRDAIGWALVDPWVREQAEAHLASVLRANVAL
jgi:hypothetical protein